MEPPQPSKRRQQRKTGEKSGVQNEDEPVRKPRKPRSTSDARERVPKENVEQPRGPKETRRKKDLSDPSKEKPKPGESSEVGDEIRKKPRRPRRRPAETRNQEMEGKQIGVEMDERKRPPGRGKLPSVAQEPEFRSNAMEKEPEPSLYYFPATFTGFGEMATGRAFLLTLLWLPRFFIPWIAAWHEFNVFILSNPYHWDPMEGELQKQELFVCVVKCIATILCSALADIPLLKKKLDLKYYIYLILLVFFTFTPVIGGLVDVLLRAQFYEKEIYTKWWFTSVVLMKWVSSFSFIMFPVTFACIYDQNNNMSRNAHYNWTSIFVLLEFINSYTAYWVIPGPCPTQDWTQIVVWVGIGLLLVSVTILALIFFFAVNALKYAMVMCYNCCRKSNKQIVKPRVPEPFIDAPSSIRMRKLKVFCMIAAPVVFSYFLFAVLERLEPDEDWDKHMASSASSMFLFGKIIGVSLMVLVMFAVRKLVKRYFESLRLKAEILIFGVPHVFSILALLTLVGRFATLSHLNEGDVIVGPIPDNDTTVFVFVNGGFRNTTICISSDYFPPFKIKPRRHVTRELHGNSGVAKINFSAQVDPCSSPGIQMYFLATNFTGGWRVYRFSLRFFNSTNEYIWDYYRRVFVVRLFGVENLHPKGAPLLALFRSSIIRPPEKFFYRFNHSSLGSVEVNTSKGSADDAIIWEVPSTGRWSIEHWSTLYNISHEAYAWATNATLKPASFEFETDNFSLYLLVESVYREGFGWAVPEAWFYEPPPHIQFPGHPRTFMIFKLAEIAGPGSNHLPCKKQLQKDWVIKTCMALAGIAAGGIFLGFIYLFWVDPPLPHYRTISLAICWSLMGLAAEMPRIKLVDVGVKVSSILLAFQIIFTGSHFAGSYFMYTKALNFRKRPD